MRSAARRDGLKEYVIGTEVYDRKPPYHPSQDSIVRTEARRLRTKLKEYYEAEGKNNPIFIYFRPGSYVPVFRSKVSAPGQETAAGNSAEDVFIEGPGVSVAVIPFLDSSEQPLSAKYARGVTDELIHEIMQCDGCRVVATSSIREPGYAGPRYPVPGAKTWSADRLRGIGASGGKPGSRYIENGECGWFSTVVATIGCRGRCSEHLHRSGTNASALVNRVRPQQSIVRTAEASAGPVILAVYPCAIEGGGST